MNLPEETFFKPMNHSAHMSYERKRVAERFDELLEGASTLKRGGIVTRVGEVSFEMLRLSREDVLLDVGTGTGAWAIRAAPMCRLVIGIDISRRSLEIAEKNARLHGVSNVIFAAGSFENPCEEMDLHAMGITRVLALYSLHHLPDDMKAEALKNLASILRRPGRMVIGDIMFFEPPEMHVSEFDDVGYDGGTLDFPSTADFLCEVLRALGAEVHTVRLHPLAGVVCGIFHG